MSSLTRIVAIVDNVHNVTSAIKGDLSSDPQQTSRLFGVRELLDLPLLAVQTLGRTKILLRDCRRGVNDRSRASRPILHDHRKDPTRCCRQKRKRACSSNFATERVTTIQTLFFRSIDRSPRRLPLCNQVSTLCTHSPETISPTVNALARLASSPIPWIHIIPVHIRLLRSLQQEITYFHSLTNFLLANQYLS